MASILKVNTIQDATNSTTAMTIDSSGRILTPARPSFQYDIQNYSGGTNKLSSPKIRFYFQIFIVLVYIILNETYIYEIRLNYPLI